MELPGYQLLERLGDTGENVLYRMRQQGSGRAVLCMTTREEHPGDAARARYKQEYELLQLAGGRGAVRPLELTEDDGRPLLMVEDFGGVPLALLPGRGLPHLLEVAMQIARCLAQVHRQGIVHQAVTPAHILVHPRTREVRLIGFQYAFLTGQGHTAPSVARGGSHLVYIAPEQTGRTTIRPDTRSDIYSMGVCLYEWISGRRPFDTEDALELIYAHLAGQPQPLGSVQVTIPQPLSAIVRQCMEKEPQQRYASAQAVYEDLARCLEQLRSGGELSNLDAAGETVSENWFIPSVLYGREEDSRRLLWMLNEGAALVLVNGQAGIGKTAFVRETLQRRGDAALVISGKFELDATEIPYSAWIQAVEALVSWLLMQPEYELAMWRKRIDRQIGGYEQLLINWAPKLGMILSGGTLQSLPPMEEKQRFQQILYAFIQLFADGSTRLIVFLDDLQWADEASLLLIEHLLDGRADGLQIIGTCRPREEAGAAWLSWSSGHSEQDMGLVQRQLTLDPLGKETIAQWLASMLGGASSRLEELAELAGLIVDKTGGNPLLIHSFLQYAYAQGAFRYRRQAKVWDWELRALAKMDDPLYSTTAMAADRMAVLGSSVLELLAWAALIGRRFELGMLVRAVGRPREEVLLLLMDAVRQGVLQYIEEGEQIGFIFLHDRLRQACLSRIPEGELTGYHYRLGHLWREAGDHEASLFEALIHLNQARVMIRERSEQLELARMNYQAGQRAMQSTAWAAALRYICEAASFAGAAGWEDSNELTFEISRQRVICEFLCGDREKAYELFELLLVQSPSEMTRVDIYIMMIRLESNCSNHTKAMELAEAALRLLGVKLPSDPSLLQVAQRWIRVQWRIKARGGRRSLLKLPQIVDKRVHAILNVLHHSSNARFSVGGLHWFNAMLEMMSLTLRYGQAPESANAYIGMALVHNSLTRNYRAAYEWGTVAKEIGNSKAEVRVVVLNTYALCVDSWLAFDPGFMEVMVHNAQQAGVEPFSLWQAEQSVLFTVGMMFHLSRPLGGAYSLLIQNAGLLIGSQDMEHWKLGAVMSTALRRLIGKQAQGDPFVRLDTQAPEFLLNQEGKFMPSIEFAVCVCGSTVSYIFGQYEDAYNYSVRLMNMGQGDYNEKPNRVTAGHDMYLHLAMAELYPIVTASERRSFIAIMRKELQMMKRKAARAPRTTRHKYLMMAAEYARIIGKPRRADRLYELACQCARENGFIHDLAIASENACRHNIDQGRMHLARAYITQSYQAYTQWGAAEKASQMAQRYRHLLFVDPVAAWDGIDYQSVMNSAQAISEEMRLDRLLVRLMRILIVNAGAEKGALVIEDKGRLYVEAQAASGSEPQLARLPLEETELPHAIISYVSRTKEQVALDYACREGIFVNVPYIRDNGVKSMLCIPMMKNDRLISVVYLENNLAAGVFSPERLDALKLLCAQCAISIDNAQLYMSSERLKQVLEEQVKERTHSLELSIRETAAALAEASIQLDRNRIAADVHDIVGHTITSTLLQIEAAKRQMSRKPEEARDRLQGVQDMLRDGLNEIRGSIHMLKGSREDNLVQSLQQLIATTEQHTGITVNTEIEPLIRVDQTCQHVLYYALKEGLTNGIRHGGATWFSFTLRRLDGKLEFILEDNGHVVEPIVYGFGLNAMKERANGLGGWLSIEVLPARGCRLSLHIPYINEKEQPKHVI